MDGSQGYEPRVYYTPTMGYDAGSSGCALHNTLGLSHTCPRLRTGPTPRTKKQNGDHLYTDLSSI